MPAERRGVKLLQHCASQVPSGAGMRRKVAVQEAGSVGIGAGVDRGRGGGSSGSEEFESSRVDSSQPVRSASPEPSQNSFRVRKSAGFKLVRPGTRTTLYWSSVTGGRPCFCHAGTFLI